METNMQNQTEYHPLDGPKGLGGWLVLIQIGLFLTLLMLAVQILQSTIPSLKPDIWGLLTAKDSELYHVLWGPIIIFEAIANVGQFLFCLFVLGMFYSKKSSVPLLMIIFYGGSMIIGIIDYALVQQIPIVQELEDGSSVSDIGRSVVTCAIWIPYFLKSRRVRNTFVQ
ncbi:DUF2569 domain-containing protein [Paenibacillus sp. MMS20-IR301]|uniref:DUF2569 domain-containing protein n=1 Tax=Paenibacillus sp. MMS20-IR301 TaxID=2895946 RepID=UPI0028E8CB9F|nr:DUF2569 domain-containing protein [Paenibacillus sp. MMS20-IR301]WNS46066.1 DUF2569 domain-containing protein [Paenibacillus sp. MMS20-IR301]